MSIESQIITAMAGLSLPCAYDIYEGNATIYTHVQRKQHSRRFCDDAPQHDRWLIQLHLFAPFTTDTTELRKQIKAEILAAGFTYPLQVDVGGKDPDEDGTERHIVFEFEAVEGVGV